MKREKNIYIGHIQVVSIVYMLQMYKGLFLNSTGIHLETEHRSKLIIKTKTFILFIHMRPNFLVVYISQLYKG